nr:hypothetical protein [uncultured Allomuricauda sp.]
MKRKSHFQMIKKQRFFHRLFAIILVSCSLVSCSEDEGPDCSLQGTNYSVSDISGNWTATEARFFNVSAEPIQVVDVVAEGGSVTLSIQSNGRFTLNITESGEPSSRSSGDLCFDEDLLVVRFDGDAADDYEFFRITFNGTNNLSFDGPAEFDFNDDGTPDPADISLALVRS